MISEVGDVTIGGIDGSFRVHAAVGNISLQINKIKRLQSRSCEAVAVKGTLSVRVDPEVIENRRFKSVSVVATLP